MVRIIFIRHGQSASNAGLVTDDFALVPVTELGLQQAEELAQVWTEEPTHIYHSPFLRTQQTAAPTIARFSDVDVLELPVHEFTNLEPSRWNGTSPDDRADYVDAYWERCDAAFCDGPQAESFLHFYERIAGALRQLETLRDGSTAYVFSHGFAMNMVRAQIRFPELTPQQVMQRFIELWQESPIRNTERMELHWDGVAWRVASSIAPQKAAAGVADVTRM